MKSKLIEQISLWQLFTLIVNFEIGSAIVIRIGTEAKQDAWIAVGIATILGVGITWMYYYLITRSSRANLYELLEVSFGRWIAIPIGMAYVVYFFYLSARVLRDFGELMATAIFDNTPIELISVTMMLVAAYIVYLGLEVLCRTSEIFSPYIFGFLILIGLFLVLSGKFQIHNILPILPDGIKPVLTAIFPALVTFPFGEMVAFTIVMPYVSKTRFGGKVSSLAVLFAGLLLIISVFEQISTLGVDARDRSNFPLLSSSREISLAHFFERIDALVVFIMNLGILMKVCVYFYGGLKGLEYIFRLPYRSFILPMAMLIAVLSILIASDYAEHIQEGLKFVPLYLHLPFQFGIPSIVLLVLMWRLKGKSRKGGRWR